MQVTKSAKLTVRDFVYVYEISLGQTYQNGPYMIRPLPYGYSQGYRVYYRGGPMLTMTETFLSAVDACAKHDAARRNHEDEGRFSERGQWNGGAL